MQNSAKKEGPKRSRRFPIRVRFCVLVQTLVGQVVRALAEHGAVAVEHRDLAARLVGRTLEKGLELRVGLVGEPCHRCEGW